MVMLRRHRRCKSCANRSEAMLTYIRAHTRPHTHPHPHSLARSLTHSSHPSSQASYWFGSGSSANPAISATERPPDPVVQPSRPLEQGDLVTLGVIARPGYGRWSGCDGVVQLVVSRGSTQRVYVAIAGEDALVPVSARRVSLRLARPPRGEVAACAATTLRNADAANYPSTPHLPFSPQV